MKFDSSIQSPIKDAINIITNYKPYIHPERFDVEYAKKQLFTVLNERLINDKTLDEVGLMLNVTGERIRQIEAKLLRILNQKMKGYK
jgi:hypothetical protein